MHDYRPECTSTLELIGYLACVHQHILFLECVQQWKEFQPRYGYIDEPQNYAEQEELITETE